LEDVFFDNLVVQHFSGPVLEETHYYPFGLTMAGISTKALTSLENLYRYNEGSEFIKDLDLNLYETPFRSYDPQIGRFHQIDALSDLYYEWSTYSYAHNNPLLLNDPSGLSPENNEETDEIEGIVLREFEVVAEKSSGPSILNPGIYSDVPIFGPLNDAVQDFNNGHYVSGSLNVIFGLLDINPVLGFARKGLFKLGVRLGSRAIKAAKTLGKNFSKISVNLLKKSEIDAHQLKKIS
jgi:RHS repeat-associated protein